MRDSVNSVSYHVMTYNLSSVSAVMWNDGSILGKIGSNLRSVDAHLSCLLASQSGSFPPMVLASVKLANHFRKPLVHFVKLNFAQYL